MGRGAWQAIAHGITESDMTLRVNDSSEILTAVEVIASQSSWLTEQANTCAYTNLCNYLYIWLDREMGK